MRTRLPGTWAGAGCRTQLLFQTAWRRRRRTWAAGAPKNRPWNAGRTPAVPGTAQNDSTDRFRSLWLPLVFNQHGLAERLGGFALEQAVLRTCLVGDRDTGRGARLQLFVTDLWGQRLANRRRLQDEIRDAPIGIAARGRVVRQARMKLAEALSARIAELGADVAEATIGDRTAFAASMMEGRGVLESAPKGKAAEEIAALAREVIKRLKLT